MTDPIKHFQGRIQVPEDKRNLRYFKMSIFKRPRPDGAQFEDDPLAKQSFRLPGSISINPGGIGTRLPASGICIYCGASEYSPDAKRPLSDEHIVSGALGGNIILPEASCQKCAEYTSGVESAVLNHLFWATRHKLKLRSRTRRRQRRDFEFSSIVEGKNITLKLPLEKHPTILFMPSFFAPGILESGVSGLAGFRSHWLNDVAVRNADAVLTPALDTVLFCQFIAKIGHAFATAAAGGMFEPMLPVFIRRKFGRIDEYPERYHLIGGHPMRHAPGVALHELGLAYTKRNGAWLLSAQIRLFANLGMPVYVAVVGRINPGLIPEEVSARVKFPKKPPARTLDKNRADPQ